jgi:RAQPRD family integrative conjugative element protein
MPLKLTPLVLIVCSLLGACHRHATVESANTDGFEALADPAPQIQRDSVALQTPRTSENELTILARLEAELALLGPTLREAEMAGQNTRQQFDYEQLRLDIDRIRFGLRQYRSGELDQPRALPPISGEYRR